MNKINGKTNITIFPWTPGCCNLPVMNILRFNPTIVRLYTSVALCINKLGFEFVTVALKHMLYYFESKYIGPCFIMEMAPRGVK